MILDTARYLKEHDREVVYDAEHFFDGYKDSPEYAIATLEAARDGRADIRITRPMPMDDPDVTAPARLELYLSGGRS